MQPATYNPAPMYMGDLYNGFTMTLTRTVDTVTTPIDLAGTTLRMQVRTLPRHLQSETILDLTEGNGITVMVTPT